MTLLIIQKVGFVGWQDADMEHEIIGSSTKLLAQEYTSLFRAITIVGYDYEVCILSPFSTVPIAVVLIHIPSSDDLRVIITLTKRVIMLS